ncbi:Lysophosphatidic acid acyltransferase endophilin/SH3GL, involved in synaptic vesicle formation [Phaffia rhodozyma]|uniref:Lysophosphatidic acid acyltransferase endophilin/SH3GL, involved in synaptic vesicle formation n=1 Tax=Phaffia rhodozyma TaxID=264483 RepID=A0A0F7SV19_PHARH|nr:Lysophosphatidic acid acyltransferase endophilin/SH3GL, involved in synaptic vesicle formation [Phaffia rhodozyma]
MARLYARLLYCLPSRVSFNPVITRECVSDCNKMSFKKAGKQIDKFSQWTGEKLFKEEKTQHSRAFQDLETEVELKRKAVERLSQTSAAYLKSITKREKIEAPELQTDGSKVLLIEHVGLTMVHFGTELGLRSSYGQRLLEIGRAQCKIAAVQERYAEELIAGFLSGLERSTEEMKDYSAARKKLESRRLAMDAAQKRQLTSKKSSPALDEEVRVARARFDETQEDVEMRMEEISQNEGAYLDDLNGFLQAQVSFLDQQRDVLVELQDSLGSSSYAASTPYHSSAAPKKVSNAAARAAMFAEPVFASASEKNINRSRSNSTKSQTDNEKKSLFGSLRKKSIGGGSNGFNGVSVAGYIPGGRKSWGPLNGEEEDGDIAERRKDVSHKEAITMPDRPSLGGRRLTTSSVAEAGAGWGKIVRATFDYKGVERDELTLRVGDVITVIEEVSEDWWKGTLSSGKSGLFPSAYTQPLPLIRKTAPPVPPLLSTQRPTSAGRSFTQPIQQSASSRFSPPLRNGLDDRSTRDERSSFQYSDEDDHSHQPSRPKHTTYGSHSSTKQRGGYSDSDPESESEFNIRRDRNGRSIDRNRRSRSTDRSDFNDEEEAYDDKVGLTNTSTSPFRQPTSGVSLGLGRLGGKKPVPPPPPPSQRRGTVSGGSGVWSPGGESTGRKSARSLEAEDERNPFFDPN